MEAVSRANLSMATTNRKRWLIIGILVLLGLGAAGKLFQPIAEWHFEAEAKVWLREAQRTASADMTYDDARQWLQNHGFGVVGWEPHEGRDGIFYGELFCEGQTQYRTSVWGERELTRGNILWDPVWVDLRYIFSEDGTFDRVEVSTRPHALP